MSLHKNLLLLVIIPIFAGLPIQAGELNLDHVLNVDNVAASANDDAGFFDGRGADKQLHSAS